MNISFIGSGNVATHLALAYHTLGHSILQVWSREYDHADMLAARVGAQPIDQISELKTNADLYVLAVSDDALFDLALDLHLGDALVVHTSGATSIKVLKSVSSRYGVLWSPQTFIRDITLDYSALPFCIEGCTPAVESQIADAARIISQHIYPLNQEQRQYLHLAAVMVNNFTNAINCQAQQLLNEHQVPFEILFPLISMTAKKAQYGDLHLQQTGPAIRHDQRTLNAQRRLLAESPQLLQLYELMTQIIQEN